MTIARAPIRDAGHGRVHFRTIEGRQDDKFRELSQMTLTTGWEVAPDGPTAPFLRAGSDIWETSPLLESLMPFKSTAVTSNRDWPTAPHPEILRQRWSRLAGAPQEEKPTLLRETSDRRIESRVGALPGQTRRPPLREDVGECLDPVPIAWRSFDVQYLIPDMRVLDRPRPVLWEVRSDRQVYVLELHSEPLRSGPGLVFSGEIPASSYFKGSGGGRTYPLYRDAAGHVANISESFLRVYGERLGRAIDSTDWVEYLAGVTGYASFQESFEKDLVTPGIRVPLTTDRALFDRFRMFGQVSLAANTRRRRGSIAAVRELLDPTPLAPEPTVLRRVSTQAEDMPTTFSYDADKQVLTIGVGMFGPVRPEVMSFTTSGMNVFRKWFNYRKKNPAGRSLKGLSLINATHWYDEWTDDLVALLADLSLLTQLEPAHRLLIESLRQTPRLTVADLQQEGL
jgi:hypothetical protein